MLFLLFNGYCIKKHAVNHQIRASVIKLVDENGGLKEISLFEALEKAKEAGLDLVEVDGNSSPPVCKLMDYGKYIYNVKKQEQKAKKAQKKVETKEIRIGFATGEHDLLVKEKQSRKFLEKDNKVRITLLIKGRQHTHKDIANQKIQDFANRLADISTIEIEDMKKQASKLTLLLSPLKK